MTHTPGPWHVGQHGGLTVSVDTADGRSLTELWARSRASEHLDEAEANARLIAAAPELLDLLRHFCEALNLSDVEHPDFRDSGADVMEHLWFKGSEARALLARIDGGRS